MKSTAKIEAGTLDEFTKWLQDKGFDTVMIHEGYRVLMYRKKYKSWTQGYTGTTQVLKKPRSFIRFAGPESEAVHIFNKQE